MPIAESQSLASSSSPCIFAACFLYLHAHRLVFQKVVRDFHEDAAAGSEDQVLLDRVPEEQHRIFCFKRQ